MRKTKSEKRAEMRREAEQARRSGEWFTGTEAIALAVARITGGHYFDPDTRRFFCARIAKAWRAPDGVLYVQHSTAQPRWNIPRLHNVTAFSSGDPEQGNVHHIAHNVSATTARRVFDRVRNMGCVL